MENDWKLNLKYGRIKTPYQHYNVLADGVVGKLKDGFEYPSGKAWMEMKTWSSSMEESAEMIKVIGEQIGFQVTGKIEVYESDPSLPPQENPHTYDINFTPYKT